MLRYVESKQCDYGMLAIGVTTAACSLYIMPHLKEICAPKYTLYEKCYDAAINALGIRATLYSPTSWIPAYMNHLEASRVCQLHYNTYYECSSYIPYICLAVWSLIPICTALNRLCNNRTRWV